MNRILLVGYDPQTEDFSEPGRPPGVGAEKIEAGIELAWSRCASEVGRSISVSYGFKKQLKRLAQ